MGPIGPTSPIGPIGRLRRAVRPFRHVAEPVLAPGPPDWQRGRVYNPGAVVIGDRVALVYRAQGVRRVRARHHWIWPSVIGLAWSRDGVHFVPEPEPVLEPAAPAERAGVEDPRIVRVGRQYALTYTAYDGARARLALALTTDRRLRTWRTRRLLFPRERRWTKGGALLGQRLGGRYLLYFQMHELAASPAETHIWLASSPDLRSWRIAPRPVLTPRRGHFDDLLVEPGPPPLLTPDGILLLYNAARASRSRRGRTFAAGWALLDRHDPSQVLERCEEPILTGEHATERQGRLPQVPFQRALKDRGRIPGTIFAEGLVFFRGRWLLYYGMGDTTIGVAANPATPLFRR